MNYEVFILGIHRIALLKWDLNVFQCQMPGYSGPDLLQWDHYYQTYSGCKCSHLSFLAASDSIDISPD